MALYHGCNRVHTFDCTTARRNADERSQARRSRSGARPATGHRSSPQHRRQSGSATTMSGPGTTSRRSSATRISRSSRATPRSPRSPRRPKRVRIGLFVGANTFRNPGLAAKCLTTIDHISGGRAIMGIGGAWFEGEHTSFGIDFGSGFGQRLDWLAEAVAAAARPARWRRGHQSGGRSLRLRPPPDPAAAGAGPSADHGRWRGRAEDAADRRRAR